MSWLVAIFFPLLPALLLAVPGMRWLIVRHGLWLAGVPALILALAGGALQPAHFPALFFGTTLDFGLYGRTFLLLAALLWMAAGVFAGAYLLAGEHGSGTFQQGSARSRESRQSVFAFLYLLAMSGNLGLCVAQDLASFYVFFSMMSLAAYGLVIHDGSGKALRAGRVYLSMAVVGEVLIASAFYYAGLAGGDGTTLLFADIAPLLPGHAQESLILGLAFAGFGIKAGALFLHLWLPLAHPAAPFPASAVLSGAMIKAGLLGWLHFFAPGANPEGGLVGWGMFLAWSGLAAALYGVCSGLGKQGVKAMLAYSSVSQMGLMTMALGFALACGRDGAGQILPGLLLFVLVHGLAKGFLFLGVGLVRMTARKSMQGILVLAGLVLAGLVLAGLPYTAGAVVKQALKQGAGLLPQGWSFFFITMLPVAATGTSLLLAVFVWRVRQTMADVNGRVGPGLAAAWIGLLTLLLLAVPLAAHVSPSGGIPLKTDGMTILAGVWPIVLGLIGAMAWCRSRWGGREWKCLDELILEGLEQGLRRLSHRWNTSRLCDPACGRIDLVALSDHVLQSRWMRTIPDRLEQRLLYWHTAGALFILLLMGFIVLAALRGG